MIKDCPTHGHFEDMMAIDSKFLTHVEAMFPGYLFARFHYVELFRQVQYAPGVTGIVRFGERIAALPDSAIETMRELDLNAAARRIESILKPALAELAENDQGIAEVRGRGAMIAVELVLDRDREPDPTRTAAVSQACHAAGLLTLTCGTYGNVLRFLPPLVISDEDLHRGLDILRRALLT